jgi:hypothetical protein
VTIEGSIATNQAVTISINPSETGKSPKDPVIVYAVFDVPLSAPQRGLFVPSTESGTGASVPKFVALPDQGSTEGKGTFRPFDKNKLVITGTIAQPVNPGDPAKFIPDRMDQLNQLPREGLSGTIVPDAPGSKPIVCVFVPSESKQQPYAYFVPEKEDKSGPAVFRPEYNPDQLIFGQYIITTSSESWTGASIFRPFNPEDLSSLRQGTTRGTIVPSTNGGQPISGTITVTSSTTGTTEFSVDFKFTEDRSTQPLCKKEWEKYLV